MYITKMEWRDWFFEMDDTKQTFGKTKVEATKDDFVELLYVEADYLSEEVCEYLYQKYLYVYD